MESLFSTFGEMLRYERRKRGWTQQYVSKATGISTAAISQWESGSLTRTPTAENVSKLERLFGVSFVVEIDEDVSRAIAVLKRMVRDPEFRAKAFLELAIVPRDLSVMYEDGK